MKQIYKSELAGTLIPMIAAALLASPGAVGACEKDADCKPPSVCQNRKCEAPRAGASRISTPQKRHHHRQKASVTPAPAQ